MLRKSFKLLLNEKLPLYTKFKGHLSTTSLVNEKWDLLTAVCLERKPVITQELNEIQKEYEELLAEVEFERSLKSDHELQHELELKQIEALKKGDSDDLDVNLKQTAQDFVDLCVEELTQFKKGSKITQDDKKNNDKSLNRKLDKHLVLLVNQKLGDQKHYLLPQGKREEGETLRQAADRVLKQCCGPNVKTQIYGNAPSGFYKYKYPKQIRNEKAVGAKVFIYFARHLEGQLPDKGVDYKWLDRQEMDKILPAEYKKSVGQLLIDE
ncbi:unnamed protein product [Brassicogethes aeneus]|uniref:Large ribosomal subunit protein mL46 n=1 Tax=Brassicogethes aeneus TaxID=1431903 RepID=A0A9P0BBK8_BRAAE|nr:unnamed protein product [Brassicogethes aeneus]